MIHTEIKAVLFDKDGTLIDFMYTWYPLLQRFLDEFQQQAKLDTAQRYQAALLLGDTGHSFAPDSLFAHGNYEEIYQALHAVAPACSKSFIVQTFETSFQNTAFDARPLDPVPKILEALKVQGYILGVATADNTQGTFHTLKRAGLLDFFDFIGCEDSVARGKPYPDLMEKFCSENNLRARDVAMVGDTLRDMEFAKNSGAGLALLVDGVFAGTQAKNLADSVIPDIGSLLTVLHPLVAHV